MTSYDMLYLVIAGVVLAATLVEWHGIGVSERHHVHHDTYAPPSTLIHALVVFMVAMGVTGIIAGSLMQLLGDDADFGPVMCFFTAFEVVSLALWLCVRRYKVVTFEDRLEVTPFLGPTRTVRFADITAMRWSGVRLAYHDRALRVWCGGRRPKVRIWGGVDIDQVLMAIDRFDVLQGRRGYAR